MAKKALLKLFTTMDEKTLGEVLLRLATTLLVLAREAEGQIPTVINSIVAEIQHCLMPENMLKAIPLPSAMLLTPTPTGLRIPLEDMEEISAMFAKRKRMRMYSPIWATRVFEVQPLVNFADNKWPKKTCCRVNTAQFYWRQRVYWCNGNIRQSILCTDFPAVNVTFPYSLFEDYREQPF